MPATTGSGCRMSAVVGRHTARHSGIAGDDGETHDHHSASGQGGTARNNMQMNGHEISSFLFVLGLVRVPDSRV
jgi:hypothetical protein